MTIVFRVGDTGVADRRICCHQSTKLDVCCTAAMRGRHWSKTGQPGTQYSWAFSSAAPAAVHWRGQRPHGGSGVCTLVTLFLRFVVTSVTGGLICCHKSTKFAAGFTLDVPAGHRRKTARPATSYLWAFPRAAPAGSQRHTPSRRGGYQTLYSCDTNFELLRHQCHYRRNLLSLEYKVPRPHMVRLPPGLFQCLGETENPVPNGVFLRLAGGALGLAHSTNEAKPNFVLS